MKRIILSLIAMIFLVLPSTGLSQIQPPEVELGVVLYKIIAWLFWLLIFAAALGVVVSGFLFVSAGGSDDRIKQARQVLIYSLVGLLVGGLSSALVGLVRRMLGV